MDQPLMTKGESAAGLVPIGDPYPGMATMIVDDQLREVEVGEDLQIKLSGWAVPVFRGTLAEAFLEELHATK